MNFHNFCDNKGASVVVISANGQLFGGYTSKKWEISSQYITDEIAFLFSLTHNKKYPINTATECWAIFSPPNSEIAFYFGYPHDLNIYNGFLSNKNNKSNLSCYRNSDGSQSTDLIANTDGTFVIDEMEVY